MRLVTSLLWLLVMLAFGFDAVAQPCDLRANMEASAQHEMMADMPCHDGMMQAETQPDEHAPEHRTDACCCAALLTNLVNVDPVNLKQPLTVILAWTTPLNDRANSVPLKHDPPPPRA